MITHPLKPIYDKNSKILILGTMPSVKSREIGFYYANPKNRFWQVLRILYNEDIGESIEDKTNFLLKHNIALFDVLKSCDINSSSDSSIKNPVPNDFTDILNNSNIKTIFTLGRKAYDLYQKYCYPKTNIEAIYLPSTSPANCAKNIEALIQEFSIIKKCTDK